MENTKQSILMLIEQMLKSNVLHPINLKKYTKDLMEADQPEKLRDDLENWYRNAGIETVTGRSFSLSDCPFTHEEILAAKENNEMIICIPANVTRQELGKLFHIDSWALSDPLSTPATEKKDCWMKTSMNLSPGYMKQSGIAVSNLFEEEKKLNFSLERYIVYLARMQYLTGQLPDKEYWIWLPRGRYDRSGMLIAGYDRNLNFNVHGWMPQFEASFLGARFGERSKTDS